MLNYRQITIRDNMKKLKKLSTHHIRSANHLSKANLTIFALVFAAIGGYVIYSSFAAGFTTSFEAENSTKNSPATTVADASASGGSALKFAAAGSANSCPAYPKFPDASCTGYPVGTTLTVKNGDQTINTAGTVVSGWDVRGKIIVNADNVTIKNSITHGPAVGGCSNGASIELYGQNDVVQDTEVVLDHPTACLDGIWMAGNFQTLTRVNVHAGTDGVKAGADEASHDFLVQDSYLHGMRWDPDDPNQGHTETHNDGVQTWSLAHNVTLRHNRIDLSTVFNTSGELASNAAWQDGAFNSRAENNYLDGGGCTLNFAAQGTTTQNPQTPLYVNNNHFGRIRGFNGCVVLINNQAVMTEYNGNVYDDTGTPVPTWQQHN
jgi:hypothetical protein